MTAGGDYSLPIWQKIFQLTGSLDLPLDEEFDVTAEVNVASYAYRAIQSPNGEPRGFAGAAFVDNPF